MLIYFYNILTLLLFSNDVKSPDVTTIYQTYEIREQFYLDKKWLIDRLVGHRGQHVWLLIMRSRVRSPALPQILNVD